MLTYIIKPIFIIEDDSDEDDENEEKKEKEEKEQVNIKITVDIKEMSSKQSSIDLFKELAKYDEITTLSEFANTNMFIEKYACLQLGNGGSWCRFDGKFGRKNKVITVKENGKIKYSWIPLAEEEHMLKEEVNQYRENHGIPIKNGIGIQLIKICGIQDESYMRPIRVDIRNALKNQQCVVCGTTSNIEIDHKNGLYNNDRVLNEKTQTIDDFMPLCKHCNDQKRQVHKIMKETGKRYGATNIPQFKCKGVDFIQGDDTFDLNDPEAMIGTYWYDPVEFTKVLFS